MKSFFLFCFSALLFCFAFFHTTNLTAQCTGDIVLETQVDVDAFAVNYGCSVIEGDLTIGTTGASNNITDLSPLESITTIQGDLIIHQNNSLNNLNGLQNINTIGEDLTIFNNDNLSSLDELSNLSQINGDLSIYYNDNLTNLEGLQNIALINGDLDIVDNDNLHNFDGLQSIALIGGNLSISYNENLTNLDGLQNITQINGNLNIFRNNSINNLIGLQNIALINGDLDIVDNENLHNFDGLQSIALIGGNLNISNNDNLHNFDGLQSIALIGGNLNISNNDNLHNFDGLQSTTNIEGNLDISYNENLSNLNGLQSIVQIGGYLKVYDNDNLSNLDGLQNITNIEEYLDISNNDNLSNLDGLQNIVTINGYLNIFYNENLSNLNGLQNIITVNGYLDISYNDNLSNLDGLQNIVTVNGYLDIYNNNNLSNLNGLQNIANIGGYLNIFYNDNLSNLNGLQNITHIEGDLTIRFNDNLETCCDILPSFEGIEGDITISNNSLGCNSIEEVLEYCIKYQIQTIAFFDENENNTFDSNEQSIQQGFNLEPNPTYSFTDQSGIAYFYLYNFGEYQLSINNNPIWESNGTNGIQINYVDYSTFGDTLHYFPMTPVADFIIQSIDLSSSITRCNQSTNYWLTYTNTGTTINDGYIELIPDDSTTFVSANPPADSTAGNKLYWFYEDLYPTHSQQINLVYQMPDVGAIGEQIAFEANIETNEGFGDHKAILSSELICAYDPNDKLVTPFGYSDENYTLFGDTLEYTVRFQNTGNDTAFTVIIEDELSEYLDLNTFRPIASSHNVETRIDIDSRLATFTFNDIYLPDSFVNEVGSHGFVKYQILGNENLSENTDVKNTANIFFDLNPPIITNTVNNRLVSKLPILPILTVNAEELIFEEITLDEAPYVPQILIVENVGELTLHIEQFVFADSNFNSGQTQFISVEGQSSVEVPIYFAPNEAGSYQSQLTLQSNVGELTIDLTGSAVLETGLNSVETNSVKLFPNPNEGRFYIESQEHKILSFQIINSLGKTVLEEKTNEHFSSIDLSKMGKGLYFISLQTEEGHFVEKIIIQ